MPEHVKYNLLPPSFPFAPQQVPSLMLRIPNTFLHDDDASGYMVPIADSESTRRAAVIACVMIASHSSEHAPQRLT